MHPDDFEELRDLITTWASNIGRRIRVYLFGSRLQGVSTEESDLDLAIEFLDHNEVDSELLWDELADGWQDYLSTLIGLTVDLQLYLRSAATYLELAVNTESKVLFEPKI